MIVKVSPKGSMDQLSQLEVDRLKNSAKSALYQLYRNCSLAVLAAGLKTDNSKALFEQYHDFDINVLQRERGVKLELINPPNKPLSMVKLSREFKSICSQSYAISFISVIDMTH